MICSFIEQHRDRYGVVPICRVLTKHNAPIAPRTFYAWTVRAASKRALWDAVIVGLLAGYYAPADGRPRPESLYGARKMHAHLQRQGIPVARCTVERLMAAHGWQGVRRTKKVHTTIADPHAARAKDLVDRQFAVPAPDRLWVADFTYVRLDCGRFAYAAFVIDAFADRIVGWHAASRADAAMVITAVSNAVAARAREGRQVTGVIAHNDAGTQYTSLAFGAELAEHGLLPSIGSVGDAFDNALAETIIGLYKTECIRSDSPFRDGPLNTTTDVERLTAAYVHWFNTERLLHRIGLVPPDEAEQAYYEAADQPVSAQN